MSLLAGCGSPAASFVRYETWVRKVEKDTGDDKFRMKGAQLAEVDDLLAASFGTPDEPVIPAVEGAELLSLTKLKLAAGPVSSAADGSPRGLYREHCAHCHGITGDGNGPTAAFLNPYPRDYRPGKFKFKSTPIGSKPTHADLKKIVLDGIPGTAMPSFKLLTDVEVEALVQYVKYLSIRGEVERNLLKTSSTEIDLEADPSARLVSIVPEGATAEQKKTQQDQLDAIRDEIAGVFKKWTDSEAAAVEIKPDPRGKLQGEALAASQRRGRELFYGTVANCVKCHGDSALGDGTLTDYDDWAVEFITKTPDRQIIREYVAVGLPQPRNIRPRNLRQGVYRGGMRPIDLYWRLKNGIEGTPMPAVTMKPEGDPSAKGLTTEDIWDILNYVQSLPFESISNPFSTLPTAPERERSS
ncbi:MAG: cytochrome c [Planctomycetaceae bacterium]|nr:cytochrome c [Planctomycetaceae bacterium]